MVKNKIYQMKFSYIYKMYVQKAKKKKRTADEVNEVICWLTGYKQAELQDKATSNIDMETFFNTAPALNPNRTLITGSICGVKINEIEETLMKEIRYLDKLIDELAKGKSMDKILRS